MIYQTEPHTIQPPGLPKRVARHSWVFGEMNGRPHLHTERAQSNFAAYARKPVNRRNSHRGA